MLISKDRGHKRIPILYNFQQDTDVCNEHITSATVVTGLPGLITYIIFLECIPPAGNTEKSLEITSIKINVAQRPVTLIKKVI